MLLTRVIFQSIITIWESYGSRFDIEKCLSVMLILLALMSSREATTQCQTFSFKKNRGRNPFVIGLWCLILGLSMPFSQGRATAAQVTLAWDVSYGASGYKIYYGTESDNYSWFVDVRNVTGYSFACLPNGYVYFAATAYDGSGSESDFSNEVISNTSTNARTTGTVFADVFRDCWAYNYIVAIYNAGYTTGYSAGIFAPEINVTREQMAAFIVRAVEGEPATDYCSTGSPSLIVLPPPGPAGTLSDSPTWVSPSGTVLPVSICLLNVSRAQMAASS